MTNTVENFPVINIPFLYKYGMYIQNSTSINGTLHPETKLSVLAGNCRDSNDIIDINFGDNNPGINGAITSAPVRIDNTINGAGGLDEGSVLPNTMYAIYIIADSRGYNPISAVATLGLNIFAVPSGPTMPAGYDSSRLIGFWGTDNTTLWLKGYYQFLANSNDLIFTYDSPQITSITSGSSNTFANVNLFNLVHDIANTPVSIYTVFTPGAAGDTLTLSAGLSTTSTGQVVITGQVAGVPVTSINTVLAQHVVIGGLPSPVIQYKVSGTDTVAIYVAGFCVFV